MFNNAKRAFTCILMKLKKDQLNNLAIACKAFLSLSFIDWNFQFWIDDDDQISQKHHPLDDCCWWK